MKEGESSVHTGRVLLPPTKLICGDKVEQSDVMLYLVGHHFLEEFAHAFEKGNQLVSLQPSGGCSPIYLIWE